MTLEGTNTVIVGDPESGPPVVIDPGPQHESHLTAILDACAGTIAAIVLTHRHRDHSESAGRLATLVGCDVLAADPALRIGPLGLADGQSLMVPGARIRAVATPGHTNDSYSLLISGDDGVTRLATGDTVLGRGTTVIARPDGNLRSYLASLEILRSLTGTAQVTEILPGHGPRVSSPESWLAFYLDHRLARLQQVREAVAAGDRTPAEVVARVYADVGASLWPAAEQSVAAQLDYLSEAENT
jgi:glyoxylase-like metal-dependent hydrolase (beta-lactamase superfamily II)